MIPTLSLAALALAAVAMADDNARSVSTLEFKNLFVESGIVPQVIAALDPSVSFYAGYRSASDGHSELLVPGASLTITEASLPIEFSVESLGNATGVTQQTRYLIYLVRPIVGKRRKKRKRNDKKKKKTNMPSSTPTPPPAIIRPRATSATTSQATTPSPPTARASSHRTSSAPRPG
jgi:phosphatidylethanolamine-binding protein